MELRSFRDNVVFRFYRRSSSIWSSKWKV